MSIRRQNKAKRLIDQQNERIDFCNRFSKCVGCPLLNQFDKLDCLIGFPVLSDTKLIKAQLKQWVNYAKK